MADTESVEEVQARHKKEVKALSGSGRKLLKQANKNKAKLAEAEAQIAKMDQETKERHRRELDKALSQSTTKASGSIGEDSAPPGVSAGAGGSGSGNGRGGSDGGDGGAEAVGGNKDKVSEGLGGMSVADRERATRDQKRAKAQRKREKQREKELERAKRIEKEKEEGGPDPRVIEMENLRAQIAPGGFYLREIKADGHCLYRAVAEQLALTGRRPELSQESYPLMREVAARQLRSSPGEFLPFLEDIEEGEGFEQYCVSVQESAEWGGHVELQAMCEALEVPVQVLSATSPPVLLGSQYEGEPLRLTYHEHYYALGAHYNSVAPS